MKSMDFVAVMLSLIPFLLLFYLLVVRRWQAKTVMPLVWAVTTFILLYYWKISITTVSSSFLKGIAVTVEIGLIILGAIWLLEILKATQGIPLLRKLLGSISEDMRVQAILVAWFFGAIIEGAAGFGTPAALVAPLLVGLGFKPIQAIVIALIANSTPVTFGAVGTPILVGLGGLGFATQEVTRQASVLHGIVGAFIPLLIVILVSRFTEQKINLSIVLFALGSGIVFSAVYISTAFFIGPELPSILAGLGGLLIMGGIARFRNKSTTKMRNHLKILVPYVLIIVFLVASRTIIPIKSFLEEITFSVGVHVFKPFFAPSFFLILTALITLLIFRVSKEKSLFTLKRTIVTLKKPIIPLIFAVALAQLLLVSQTHIPSIPSTLGGVFALLGGGFSLVSPLLGVFGSFITGSNTVSNLLFAGFQSETAIALGLSVSSILALQSVGGAIGNMIAIHNVLAASATVGVVGKEGAIIRQTLPVCLVYALLVGILGLIIF